MGKLGEKLKALYHTLSRGSPVVRAILTVCAMIGGLAALIGLVYVSLELREWVSCRTGDSFSLNVAATGPYISFPLHLNEHELRTRQVNYDALKTGGCYSYLAFTLDVRNRRPHRNQINDIFIGSVLCSDGKEYTLSRRSSYQEFEYGLPIDERGNFHWFCLEEEQEHMYWKAFNLQEYNLAEFGSGQPKTIFVNFRFTADTIVSRASGKIGILDSEGKVIQRDFLCVRKHDTDEFPIHQPSQGLR